VMRYNSVSAAWAMAVRLAGREGPRRMAIAIVLTVLMGACATRTVPPVPAALTYPEFMYPALPQPLATSDAAGRIDRGWRFLQNNDLGNADREFAAAVKGSPALYPAQAGLAYVALARRDYGRALGAFALRAGPVYVPALVGRGQTLLALEREADALEAFESALAADASLAELRGRVEVLRFRGLQNLIESARAAAAAGRVAEARDAYERALRASPDSAFLYRELGLIERRQGNAEAALERFRRAAELDAADAVALAQTGELLEQRQDFAGAEAAYRRAMEIEASRDLTASRELAARIAAVAEAKRDAEMPPAFRAIAGSREITRGDLAALIGVRLENELRAAPLREVVITDTQGHWAADWIARAARAGVMDPFANHTFQPGARVTRGDLAGAASRVVALIAANRPDLRPRLVERPQIVDMAEGHLSYPAVSVAVASGAMPLLDGGRFETARPVSGAEALDVVARLRALAGSSSR
jgi:tetratricopeptide (TPR) repeat protein